MSTVRTAGKRSGVSASGRDVRTLTVAEHLVVGELPVFGKQNPELEIHRALDNKTTKGGDLHFIGKACPIMRCAGR